ncbi:helix-turn-helix domain-containing protein [Herbaspirillum camelliae]|uniref:helix-turn-helix domain-containing protein n=1 Tax=Herbaspirillum camelliae TaxID=1892903 RepID=UPI000949FCCE|nr:helix-turn-helix transcriptional regulator [Herbaspirillum camelliae]
MKIHQAAALSPQLAKESADLGRLVARLRRRNRLKQVDAAALAGIARSSASRLEVGDGSVAIGMLFRYLDAIAPGVTLKDLLNGTDAGAGNSQRQILNK